MSLKRLFLILVIVINFIYVFSEKIPIEKEKVIIGYLNTSLEDSVNKEAFYGYLLNLHELDKELDYFVLGTLNSYDLIFEFSKSIGSFLKRKGYDFVVFGNLATLKKGTENFLEYIASSPYIVSQVLYTMIRGFETSGIFPVIYLRQDFDSDVKNSLEQKAGKVFYYSNTYDKTFMFYDKIEKKVFLNNDIYPELNWEIFNSENYKEIIKEIYENSIIVTGWIGKNYKKYYRKLPENSKEKSIVYFSKSVENLINDFINNKTPIYSAKKNWSW
ncbi:hypothetical protein XO10_00190 [Marinitoga sp. 1135]|uniref:Uncharacterized protein n=1 Tax=Marinitoga piezophila (strain DSM 14283 / JCM 11233 / KA3) TaxID=443254 RepID=H2J2Q4_MARPK|nr:hypothetical protein [Marinitoga sp. 1137]AEX84498.1 hypothetical protein Marpi_0038 [Marinitoga piezophila KA3]APT74993.1 hypothetical protein LN42_00190 [Marinitoga sp. 1137]NUU94749.1 hypothetical protein [Marinitoga sp. 1135]NUU96678.1 hypothetical protein [Marinitoga sp. 1138]